MTFKGGLRASEGGAVASDTSRGDLLRPTLGRGRPLAQAPYSAQLGFLAGFFGGPLAGLAVAFINARRLGRLPGDLVWLLGALVAYVVLVWWFSTQDGMHWMAQMGRWLAEWPRELIETLLGVLSFGLASLLHGRSQRQATIMGLSRPNGTLLGLGLIVGGWISSIILWTMWS